MGLWLADDRLPFDYLGDYLAGVFTPGVRWDIAYIVQMLLLGFLASIVIFILFAAGFVLLRWINGQDH